MSCCARLRSGRRDGSCRLRLVLHARLDGAIRLNVRGEPFAPVRELRSRSKSPRSRQRSLRSTCAMAFAAIIVAAPSAFAQSARESAPSWQYGGFIDAAYLFDSNHPSNRRFRSRGTTAHVDEVDLNMAGLYLNKPAAFVSPLGLELTVHAGKDAEVFGFSATAPNLEGADVLRHLGPTNVSYLAPVGNGLTVQAGIFNSLIGYDSLYAKNNLTYTRPWGADFTPYLMLGANASYPITEKLVATACITNGYWHLARANDVPSSCAQLTYKPIDHVAVKQTVLYGPHQADTSLTLWRVLADTIAEYRNDTWTSAFEFFIGTERVAGAGDPRALWLSAQLPFHWLVHPRFGVTIRPELYWDRDGRTTGFRQTVVANTAMVEYRVRFRDASAIVRLEQRVDYSRGREGGFFYGDDNRLVPRQHIVVLALILTFDGAFRP